MNRTKLQEEILKMRFSEAYEGWKQHRLTQEEASRLLGVSDRTFRRYITDYEAEGFDALLDKRINQVSHRRAPVDEVLALNNLYQGRYSAWNMKHFFAFYRKEHQGARGYTWVKKTLQEAGIVTKAKKRGKHRKKPERSPMPGMMIHQDGSTHNWIPDEKWDLIVTMDDATSEHYSMFFVEEEGTESSFRGVKETIEKRGLFCSFYSDRGSHYWTTPKELALHGITSMEDANRYLNDVYMPAFNKEFMVEAISTRTAFVPLLNCSLDEVLCEHYERTATKNNCVSFEGLTLQIPKDEHRCHYHKTKVRIHRYVDGHLAIFHGPRKLAEYDNKGGIKVLENDNAA